MKIALLADIHGNYVALETCLNYIDTQNVDGIAFLGDYISDCPYPQRTMELVYKYKDKYPCWFIKGNREDYFIEYNKHKSGWKYSSNSGSLLYTYENLTQKDIEFFESMPICKEIQIENYPSFTICHGSPSNVKEELHPDTEASKKCLKKLKTDYLFSGHCHRGFKYIYESESLVNCGSVGAQTNGQTKVTFVMIEYIDGKWQDELINLPYDIEKIISAFEESGLDDKAFIWAKSVKKLLYTGRNYPMECLLLAAEKMKQSTGKINYSDVPEEFWESAAKELEII